MSVDTITIRRPDDWHVHLRDGDMLKAVAPFTARQFARAIVMPNLSPPVTEVAAARTARRCFSRFTTGRQYACGLRPPVNKALRLRCRCCGVIVAATVSGASLTNPAASAVVICSRTIFNAGKSRTRPVRMRSMNTASRSKMSTSGSVTSPWTSKGMPIASIRSSAAWIWRTSVTPLALLVVAPAG